MPLDQTQKLETLKLAVEIAKVILVNSKTDLAALKPQTINSLVRPIHETLKDLADN